MSVPVLAAVLALVASCNTPPPDAYVSSSAFDSGSALAVGRNTTGEECGFQRSGGGGDIYCGKWTSQPNARIRAGGPADLAMIDQLATASPWRADLDRRLACDAPQARAILDGQQARVMTCRKRTSGADVKAFVAIVDGRAWFADGVENAVPAMERAVGVLSGRFSPEAASAQVSALAAAGTAAQALSAGDLASYDTLVRTATNANRLGQSANAESAWRDILRLQEKRRKPGAAEDPAEATALMSLALQLSNQGRFAEADGYFDRARRLVSSSLDGNSRARLDHYLAIHLLNQGRAGDALPMLDASERLYAQQSGIDAAGEAGQPGGLASDLVGQQCGIDTNRCSALAGIVEVRRNRSWALRLLGRPADSEAASQSAQMFAVSHGLGQPRMEGYLLRTGGLSAMQVGTQRVAVTRFGNASAAFERVVPASLPGAQALLRRAAEQLALDDQAGGLASCRQAVEGLRRLNEGVEPGLMKACLALYAEAGSGDQARLAEFFEAAQMIRDSQSRQFLQNAAARVSENTANPKAAGAARRLQDTDAQLADLNLRRGALEGSLDNAEVAARAALLDKQIEETERTRADAAEDVQSASPNYGQLVDPVTPLAAVYQVLRPHEALAFIRIVDSDAWSVVARDGVARIVPVEGGRARIDALVARFRAGVDAPPTPGHPFDMAAAQELYGALFGAMGDMLDDASAMVVVPTGSLLQIPFGALLTGAGDANAYRTAPWLLRRMEISHATSPASFALLRRNAGRSAVVAQRPWIGFGDFRPVSLQQAQRTFPAGCGESAALFAGLTPLPETHFELELARKFTGGSPADEITGAAFTADAVRRLPLEQYRIVHFATHALLPTELKCQAEPALVTSAPASAADAAGAFLSASSVQKMQLSADLVLLSACNTGGPSGDVAAESLSGLARSFFYAGARDLVITHWDADSNVAAVVIAAMLKDTAAIGPAAALRKAQLRVLDESTRDAALQSPYYWGVFAVIGQGAGRSGAGRADVTAQDALSGKARL